MSAAESPTDALSLWALANWVRDDFGSGCYVYSTAILRRGPAGVRTKAALDECVAKLVKAGWLEPVNGGIVIGGAIRWRVWKVVGP